MPAPLRESDARALEAAFSRGFPVDGRKVLRLLKEGLVDEHGRLTNLGRESMILHCFHV